MEQVVLNEKVAVATPTLNEIGAELDSKPLVGIAAIKVMYLAGSKEEDAPGTDRIFLEVDEMRSCTFLEQSIS